VSAVEGRYINVVDAAADTTYGQQIGVSNQQPNMSFELPNTPVVDGSISVYIQYGTIYSKWTQVQHLLDYGPNDLVYTVKSDANNVVSISFGDGVSGTIPVNSSVIRAMYIVGGGSLGNISSNILDTLSYIPSLTSSATSALASAITVANGTAALGGADPESNDEIRVSAPLVLRASNRAITLQDYEDLALSVTGVGKANAYGSNWTSITVYIAPSRNINDTDIQPGLLDSGAVSTEYTDLADSVTEYLSDKLLIGSSVTIQPPSYSDLVTTVQYVKLPQYTQAETDINIKKALLFAYGYTGMSFQATMYPQDIEYTLNQTEGIKTAKLTSLYKNGSSITGNATNVKVGYNLDTVAAGYVTYTVNQRHAMKAGGTVTITGLSATGFNVSNASIVAVDDYRLVVANATTGTASGTGIVTGLAPLNGFANEIFRFKESNMNIAAYSG
jgi:predicted phage baseplate assembly protein